MAFVCLPLFASAQYVSKVWSPDRGDGTYTNPVINADYSDPDVCVGASGEDYYMRHHEVEGLGELGDYQLCLG